MIQFFLFLIMLLQSPPCFPSESNTLSLTAATETAQSTPFPKENVTVNLLWVNRKIAPGILPEVIAPRTTLGNVRTNIDPIEVCAGWLNKGFQVTLWYDSHFIEDPKAAVAAFSEKHPNLILKDIRNLYDPGMHPDFFSDSTPLFARIDLLKQCIADIQLVSAPDNAVCIVTDFSIPPLPYDALLDPKTTDLLKKYGIVMTESKDSCFENGFQMTTKKALDTLQETVIENILNLWNNEAYKSKFPLRPEFVYNLLPLFLRVQMQQITHPTSKKKFQQCSSQEQKTIIKIYNQTRISAGLVFSEPIGKAPYTSLDWPEDAPYPTKEVAAPVSQIYHKLF